MKTNLNKNILVIAPHADDEVLGCGATIAKHVDSGCSVSIIIATNAAKGAPEIFSVAQIETVRREAMDAHQILGVKETIFLDFPAPALDCFPSYKISKELAQIIDVLNPDCVYLPFPGDLHCDHAVIYRASLVALRPLKKHRVSAIYCYETLSETNWSPSLVDKGFSPNCFVDVSGFIRQKLKAFEIFKSQIRDYPHCRSIEALLALSKVRGSTIGVECAESFMVERLVW